MATVLGKRKARTATAEAPAISPEEAQELLRRHFEAQFQPLDAGGSSSAAAAGRKDVDGFDDDRSEASDADEDDEDDEDEAGEGAEDSESDDWGGISDNDAKTPAAAAPPPPPIEVVEHVSVPDAAGGARADPALRRATKAYLSSRVPTASTLSSAGAPAASNKKGAGGGEGDDETSAALLRNDLALQRLLSESHLFAAGPLGGGGAAMEHTGRNRHLATDLRLAALGSKGSIYKQAKMPMAHRKGIIATAEAREARRRREARENGVVLEKPTAGVHEGWTGLKNAKKRKGGPQAGTGAGGSRRREAAVDAPAVGKLRNGMLQLSKKDVQSIQGGGGGGGAPRGGKRRRR